MRIILPKPRKNTGETHITNTLALGLNAFRNYFPLLPRTDYLMAIATLMVLPMILMFLLAQRYIVQGFVTSGLKG